jgi:LEA14-like dessication related protein
VIHFTKIFRPNKKDISIRNLTCSLTTDTINMGGKNIEKIGYQPKKKGPFNE